MNKGRIIAIAVILFSIVKSTAQNVPAIKNGTIEYQMKVNLYALLDGFKGLSDDEKLKVDKIKEGTGQFSTEDFTLSFQNDKCLFKRNKPGLQNTLSAVSDLVIYTDLNNKSFYEEKTIGNDKFYISDSIIPITWRITSDTQNIQGINCRRANGLLFDSVYAVAFFADNIPVSGGPDIFNGLPGMILELAIPQFHTTWLATKISIEQPKDNSEFYPKAKNKKAVNYQSFINSITKMSKNWGFLKDLFFNEIRI